MAQKIQTLFIDDLDGGEAAGTVRFGLDGTEYEIDLSKDHTDALHTALGKYVEHARKVGGAARRQARGGRRSADVVDTAKVREWAKVQGIDIKDRGRVPGNIVEQYRTTVGA
jgi:Lsr2